MRCDAMRCDAGQLRSFLPNNLIETGKATVSAAEPLLIDFKGQTEYIRDG